jgi:hypothetical protein
MHGRRHGPSPPSHCGPLETNLSIGIQFAEGNTCFDSQRARHGWMERTVEIRQTVSIDRLNRRGNQGIPTSGACRRRGRRADAGMMVALRKNPPGNNLNSPYHSRSICSLQALGRCRVDGNACRRRRRRAQILPKPPARTSLRPQTVGLGAEGLRIGIRQACLSVKNQGARDRAARQGVSFFQILDRRRKTPFLGKRITEHALLLSEGVRQIVPR